MALFHRRKKNKICDKSLLSGYLVYNLKGHLKRKHPQIIKEIQKEIDHSSISEYFISNISDEVKCKICGRSCNVLQNDINDLACHLVEHGINKKTEIRTGNDMNTNNQLEENKE